MPCRPQKATSCKKQPGLVRWCEFPRSVYRVSPSLSPSPDYISLYGIDKVHRRFLYFSAVLPPSPTASFSPLSEFDVSLTFSVIFFPLDFFFPFLFRREEREKERVLSKIAIIYVEVSENV